MVVMVVMVVILREYSGGCMHKNASHVVVRDWSLITGRGGGATKREGGM